MSHNLFGHLFRITTWGESHGKAVGVVIDGCPAGIEVSEEEINEALKMRAPGRSLYTSPRAEKDEAEVLSGLFEGKTTGAPISIMITHTDVNSSSYEKERTHFKPGHAHFSYLQKYGIFDYRGGGRASARETVCRVAAGAVARKLLIAEGIDLVACLTQVGSVRASLETMDVAALRERRSKSEVFCPDFAASKQMMEEIAKQQEAGDSLGGVVTFIVNPMAAGVGEPVYNKLEASLAYAMLSIPASKGFEIGRGFESALMLGSEHNDALQMADGQAVHATNNAGGIVGGISTGEALFGRVAFKPTSSIKKEQKTVTTDGKETAFSLGEGARHDPCVAIRAVAVVEAMAALVVADGLMLKAKGELYTARVSKFETKHY